jgi:hypothetical protein
LCIDVQSDPMNCGSCDNNCDSTFGVCSNGDCGCAANSGLSPCGSSDFCADLMDDPRFCGDCGTQCSGGGAFCVNGTCGCAPGLMEIGGNCIDLQSDPDDCGTPGNACTGQTANCDNGTCVQSCPQGKDDCSDACVDTNVSILHCGSCGNACANDEVCVAGSCQEWRVARGCDACPCAACTDSQMYPTCCVYPGAPNVIACVEGNACP